MQQVLHRAESRGHAYHGWLDSHHTFSFASYYHPERVHFGALRVLNDDVVSAGQGFGTHPHQNMEIVSIPLRGDLAHKDSMGHVQVIQQGDVQIMSAGTGVTHSEFNHSPDQEVNFLQIWILPQQQNIAPRYAQKHFAAATRQNQFEFVVSPSHEGALWINQQAYFSLATLTADAEVTYSLQQPGHGVYLFVIEGQLEVAGQQLHKRDGLGLWELPEGESLNVKALAGSEVLLIEVPMRA